MWDAPGASWFVRVAGLVEDLRRREDRLALLLSLVIGALVGLVVVAFILLTGRLAAHMYPAGGRRHGGALPCPTLGSLVTGFLLFRFFPDARGSGIPQTRAAIFIHDGRISFRTVVGKFLCCSTSLASGIALGREGPSVHIGAGIASVIARRLGLSTAQVRWLIPVGASAALAAAFNTPIAAVLFSLEEIMGDMHAPILGSVVLSSTTSWMVLHLVLGDEPLFHVAAITSSDPAELLAYVVLGDRRRTRLGRVRPPAARAAPEASRACRARPSGANRSSAACVSACSGSSSRRCSASATTRSTACSAAIWCCARSVLLAVLKIIATAVCYASGNAGGIFGPSMFIGAMIGAAVGTSRTTLPDDHGRTRRVCARRDGHGVRRHHPHAADVRDHDLRGDAELHDHRAADDLESHRVLHLATLQHEPIYEALARQDGLHLPTGAFRQVARPAAGQHRRPGRRRPRFAIDLSLVEAADSDVSGLAFGVVAGRRRSRAGRHGSL